MKKVAVIVCLAALFAGLTLFPAGTARAGGGKLAVAVSILPQKYFVERIGGDLVEVQALVPPGAEPHAYEPKPAQMSALARTPLYLAIGAPFEAAWLPRFSGVNKSMRIVRTDEGIEKLPLAGHGHEDDDHGHAETHAKDARAHGGKEHGHDAEHDHGHDHGAFDPHVWTAPGPVRTIALNTAQALAEADPDNAAAYRKGLDAFLAEIASTDEAVRKTLEGVPQGTAFMVFHPAFAYFARDYGLREVAIEQGGKEPGPRELARLTEEAREEGVKVIFVEPQFSRKAAETVARQVGARVEVIDPLAQDWSANLLRVAGAVAAAVR